MTDRPQDGQPLQSVDGWFKLRLYRQARTEGAQWWRDQLAKRCHLRIYVNLAQPDPERDRILDRFFRAPLTPPEELPNDYPPIWGWRQDPVGPSGEALPYTTPTIVPLSFQRADEIIGAQQHANKGAGNDSQGSVPAPSQRAYDDYMIAAGKDDGLGHLKVDIEARDQQLVRNFKAWLSAYRAATGRDSPKPLEQVTFVKWHDARILPAFDLLAWQTWTNDRSLTYDKLGELLYPPNGTYPKKIERLKHKVAHVVSWLTVRRLTYQLLE